LFRTEKLQQLGDARCEIRRDPPRRLIFASTPPRNKNGSVRRLAGEHMGAYPMVTFLGVLAALAFGFVFGRIWQIRRDELERRAGFELPAIARMPQLRDPGT